MSDSTTGPFGASFIAVKRCCEAWNRAITESKDKGQADYEAIRAAGNAYRHAMPFLCGEDHIRGFIACVAHGMILEAIDQRLGTKLVYTAQVALSNLPREPHPATSPRKTPHPDPKPEPQPEAEPEAPSHTQPGPSTPQPSQTPAPPQPTTPAPAPDNPHPTSTPTPTPQPPSPQPPAPDNAPADSGPALPPVNTPNAGLVTGHDFSRAERKPLNNIGLQPLPGANLEPAPAPTRPCRRPTALGQKPPPPPPLFSQNGKPSAGQESRSKECPGPYPKEPCPPPPYPNSGKEMASNRRKPRRLRGPAADN